MVVCEKIVLAVTVNDCVFIQGRLFLTIVFPYICWITEDTLKHCTDKYFCNHKSWEI